MDMQPIVNGIILDVEVYCSTGGQHCKCPGKPSKNDIDSIEKAAWDAYNKAIKQRMFRLSHGARICQLPTFHPLNHVIVHFCEYLSSDELRVDTIAFNFGDFTWLLTLRWMFDSRFYGTLLGECHGRCQT